jgi:serine/threonine-protein kinase
MTCATCGAVLPDAARFCASCGSPAGSGALTVGASQAAGASPGDVTRQHPPPAAKPPSSGWLTSSDSISHGRFDPGTLLDGRYRIGGLLGRGGMGEVYRADDLRLGQPVALKLLPETLRHDSVRLAQFHNEVRTARQVSHPNVCRVYDIGEADGLLYLTMEYVDGEDLASSLRRIGRFAEDKAADIARQLCAGLAAAHHRGVIHRDLKPANVMLDGNGRVRVMDFGLATIGQVEDIRAGTPAYMAPEQLLGREVTQKSDIFALGLVLYELFTGRRAFVATTIAELVSQHESLAVTPPSSLVSTLDPAIERAILRCLAPEPDRRPGSALAVSAALPGGDPLAAALAAGETPSPEMVAAAGEGAGLSARVAWPVFLAVIGGIAAAFWLALRTSPLDRMRPEYTPEVLTQKARDAVRQLVSEKRPRDEAAGFRWNDSLVTHAVDQDKPAPDWYRFYTGRPSPLELWYRQSQEPMTAVMFHNDLLTPGLVDAGDPPPIISGMTHAVLDHQGRLTSFETIPAQQLDRPTSAVPVDWAPIFTLAGLDPSQLKSTEPLWTWLAASDTRAAWTGTWPDSGRPLRVEAAALGGRPVAFMVTGPWQKPWRMTEASDGRDTAIVTLLLAITFGVLGGAAFLARRNLRNGRGDLQGATRLGVSMTAVLMAVWFCKVHLVGSIGVLAIFLVAVCTSVFYGLLMWTIYVALEPSVRKHWPQVLVSWTNLLAGRVTDPVVGRDVLFGAALGVGWAVLVRLVDSWSGANELMGYPGDTALLAGLRSTAGVVLQGIPYAMRNVLFYFFLLFVLRVVCRNQWAAAAAFAGVFGLISALGNDGNPWVNGAVAALYFGSGAVVVLRWGLLSYAVGIFTSELLLKLPATLDSSAWFFPNMLTLLAVAAALAAWGVHAVVPRSAPPRAPA